VHGSPKCPVEARERDVQYYESSSGACPFRTWRASIRDRKARGAIDARITRLRAGNFGVSKSVGGGVSESVIDIGPGYRIYYGIDQDVIVLLCAGDKSTQPADIELAKNLWDDYKGRK